MARKIKTKAPTQTYTVRQASPKLGKVGSTVTLTARQAKYWLLAGALQATGTLSSAAETAQTIQIPKTAETQTATITTRRKGK